MDSNDIWGMFAAGIVVLAMIVAVTIRF